MIQKLFSVKLWVPLLVAVLLLQSIALYLVWGYALSALTTSSLSNDAAFRQLVHQGAVAHYADGIIEPRENRVFLPELRIYLPLNETSRQLVYSYIQPFEGSAAGSDVSLRPVIRQPLSTVEQASCTRLVRLHIGKQGNMGRDEKTTGAVMLQDGRTLHIYENTTSGCENLWIEKLTPAVTAQVLLQAKSY